MSAHAAPLTMTAAAPHSADVQRVLPLISSLLWFFQRVWISALIPDHLIKK
jgi:hypothetical protein